LSGHDDPESNANLPEGNSEVGKHPDCGSDVSLKSPVRENCTLGSVRGTAGNRRSYRADLCERKEFVQIRKYRGATKDGFSVQSKISWCNKRWHRGGFRNIRDII
jgi:hypothetical protein